MSDNMVDVVRLRDLVTIHRKVDGYSEGYSLSGENDVYVYMRPTCLFFSVAHNPEFDKLYGTDHLICSFSPKLINANYLSLLLNGDVEKNYISQQMISSKRITIESIFSSILIPQQVAEVQKAVGLLEIMRQFLIQNGLNRIHTVTYSALKTGVCQELASAMADELLFDTRISANNLSFVQPWVDIYKNIPMFDLTQGANEMLSDISMLHCIEMAFEKIMEPRSELYSNLMRYRIVRSQKD